MNQIKYIGMDVHKETISIAVMDSAGKLIMESIIETKAGTILQFIQGLRGSLYVTFEEGTWAAWLYDLAQAPCHESGGLQSAEECSAQRRKQEMTGAYKGHNNCSVQHCCP